jgi:hypothetical protein
VCRKRVGRVRRTRWLEPARAAGKRTEQQLIRPNGRQRETHTHRHQLPRTAEPAQRGLKLPFDEGERRGGQFRFRDGDQVERRRNFSSRPATEDLTETTFGSIAANS